MPFFIIQTRKTKKSLPSMMVVPSNWVEEKFVYWPPRNLISLSQNENSMPEKQTWIRQRCKLLGRAKTFQEAEEAMSTLEKVTDSEDAVQMSRGTRLKPAKKQSKFQCKSYQLISPTVTHHVEEAVTSPVEYDHSRKLPQTNPSQPLNGKQKLRAEESAFSKTMDFPAASEPDVNDVSSCPRVYDTNSEVLRQDAPRPIITARLVNPDSAHFGKPACTPNHQSSLPSNSNTFVSSPSNRYSNAVQFAPVPAMVQSTNPKESTSSIIPSSSIINIAHLQANLTSPAVQHDSTSNSVPRLLSTHDTYNQNANYATANASRPHAVVPKRQQIQVAVESMNHSSNSGYSVPQKITVPIVIGSDGKQYAQFGDECFYSIADNSNEILLEPMSQAIKQDEYDMGVDNELNMSDSQLESNNPCYSTIAAELRKMNERLDVVERSLSSLTTEVCKISELLRPQEGLLARLTEFMANFNRLMSTKHSTDMTLATTRHEEDFSEFDGMKIIDSDQLFKTFEHSLADHKYSEKFFRYLHSIYSLNGKRDSGPLFRTLIRKLVAPNVFLPYSWMGNKRAKPGSSGGSGENLNFQDSFPNFIRLMQQVLQAADFSSTREQNESLFKNLLRYKNLEMKRYESGNGERRASSSRRKYKKQKVQDVSVQSFENVNPNETPQDQSLKDQTNTNQCGNEEDISETGQNDESDMSECGSEEDTSESDESD